MVAITNYAAPATLLLGLASQALALPVAATQDIVESGLLERAIDAEIQERAVADVEERDVDLSERDLEARFFKKLLHGAAKVGKGLLGFRDLSERDIEELDERDLAELVQRYYEEPEVQERDLEIEERDFDDSELDTRDVGVDLSERDLEARFFKKLLHGAAKVGKGLLGFRDLEERDFEELDERDIYELVERFYEDDSELDTRDVDVDLSERDLEARFFKKLLHGAARVGKGLLGFRDLAERGVGELDERDLDDLVARFYEDESELDTRDIDVDLSERDLEARFFKKLLHGAAKVGKGLLGFRDIEERDVEELDERDVADLIERFAEEDLEERDFEELEERDIEEMLEERDYDEMLEARDLEARFFKKLLHGAAKVGKGLLGFRDLEERDIDDLVARTFEEADMDVRDVDSELEERDLEERKITGKGVAKGLGKVAKGAFRLFFRDISERDDVAELSERELEELAARYFDDAE